MLYSVKWNSHFRYSFLYPDFAVSDNSERQRMDVLIRKIEYLF